MWWRQSFYQGRGVHRGDIGKIFSGVGEGGTDTEGTERKRLGTVVLKQEIKILNWYGFYNVSLLGCHIGKP